ncbi:hypothetical protein L9F63_008603, partial [Diploptera punctata]
GECFNMIIILRHLTFNIRRKHPFTNTWSNANGKSQIANMLHRKVSPAISCIHRKQQRPGFDSREKPNMPRNY